MTAIIHTAKFVRDGNVNSGAKFAHSDKSVILGTQGHLTLFLDKIKTAQAIISHSASISFTRWVPVEGKSSVCLICMKYRILILIIIIISLCQILLSYIANTSRTHACPRTRAHACASTQTLPSPPPYRLALFICDQP